MRDPRHSGQFTGELRRRMVALAGPGKPRAEAMRGHDPGKPALDRRIRRVHARGSTAAADNRTPEQNRLIELERENARLRMEIGAPPSAFGVERSASRPGDPCGDAAAESASRVLEREPVRGRAFASEERLGTELFDWVSRCDNCRPHPALSCMTPVGLREAGPVLS